MQLFEQPYNSAQDVQNQMRSRAFPRHGWSMLLAVMVATGLAFIAVPVQAATRYVDPDGANAGGCLTPANACNTIVQAVTVADPGDEIKVATGTYAGPQINVNKQLTIRGGYDPDASTPWDTSTYTLTPTILDGQSADRVVAVSASGVVLENMTIRNGNATTAAPFGGFGGGVLVSSAQDVELRGLTIVDNVASTLNVGSMGGGVMVVGLSEVDIDRTLVLSNTAIAMGGGVGVSVSAPNQAILNVNSSVIAHNSAGEGGGVSTSGTGRSIVAFYHSTLGDNDAGTPGADETVFMNQGNGGSANSLNFSHSLITGNETAVRANTLATVNMLSTGIIIDTSVTNDWEGTLPVLNDALRLALSFVDQAAGDYHLVAGSPAIDIAGNTAKIDLEGRQRVNSANCTPFTLCPMGRSDDYGAYEQVNVAPSIRYVGASGTDTTNNCLNSDRPCLTPENANEIALGGDEIRFEQGTYTDGDSTCANDAIICVRQGITLTGGFLTSDWDTPSSNPELTIFDGNNLRRGIMVDYDAPTGAALIRNVTVQNGTSFAGGSGIAIGVQNIGPSQNLTIRNCIVENNVVTADGVGGGIFANDPVNLRVENCTLRDNVLVDGRGGGLGITDADGDATYTLTNLTVYNNVAQRPDDMSANGGRGGGLFLEGVGTLSQSEVYSNTAAFSGGGVSTGSNGANPTVDRVYIHDNQAGVGGGFSIFLTGGATLQNSLLVRNVATSTVPLIGQAVEVFGGNAIHAPEGGVPDKPLRVVNVTIADNVGAVPEAVSVEGLADVGNTRVNEFINVLISGNAVGIQSDGLAVATLTKVLITNDVTTKVQGFANDRLTGTPLDGVAGYVGGGNYRLQPGADGVDNGNVVSGITQDLDGVNRPVGPAFDIGAYETTLQKLNQSIDFPNIGNQVLSDSPLTVNPTSSLGLPVQITSLTPAVCTVGGSTVTLVAAGTCTLQASQPGNEGVNPAPTVLRSFEIGIDEVPQETLHLPLLEKQ